MIPEIKVTWDISFGNILTTTTIVTALFAIFRWHGDILALLAEHRLLVKDYANRNDVKIHDVRDLAMAEAAIAKSRSDNRRNRNG